MSTENSGGTAVVDATVVVVPPVVDAAGKAVVTPAPSAADAANKAGKTYDEQTFKTVVAERDAEKAARKAAETERAELLAYKADKEAAAKAHEEAEALKRGEHLKLLESEKSAHEQTKKEAADKLAAEVAERTKVVEKFKTTRVKGALDAAYAASKGNAPALFSKVVADFIADGSVKADDDGNVTGHLEAVKKILEAHPQLFANGAKEAVDKAISDGASVTASAAGFAERQKREAARGGLPRSVAEAHATSAPKPSWRTTPK